MPRSDYISLWDAACQLGTNSGTLLNIAERVEVELRHKSVARGRVFRYFKRADLPTLKVHVDRWLDRPRLSQRRKVARVGLSP
jgi:hypothetical protein